MITAGSGLRVSPAGGPYIAPSTTGAGMVRYNGGYNCLEVWDGNSWVRLASQHIDLDPEVQELLNWARDRRLQDRALEELCKKHPGVQEARERLEIMLQLVKTKEPT